MCECKTSELMEMCTNRYLKMQNKNLKEMEKNRVDWGKSIMETKVPFGL